MRILHVTPSVSANGSAVCVDGASLTLGQVARVAWGKAHVYCSEEPEIRARVKASCEAVQGFVRDARPIYGVTTGFGGMANIVIPKDRAEELQNNIPLAHKTGAGRLLPKADVRAAMLLRANSFMKGVSGVRDELIQRLVIFLNEHVTPEVYDLGSIGASGDLVPLAYIAGCITGLDASYSVDFAGRRMDSIAALQQLGLAPLRLAPKEGLAIMNGTSVMTGIAANCIENVRSLFATALGAHALILQAFGATNQSFHPFIHQHKAHPGQVWTASTMLGLLDQSHLIRNELDGRHEHRGKELIQDRYSMRCLPQFLGPIIDGLWQIERQVETEMNSATDNPLIDADAGVTYHCGNFLGQYIGVAMDQLRYYIGLTAKHLDAQIALLVAPEFNNGLSASLVGNTERKVNMGLKGLQLTANSIMPLLSYFGGPLVDRFPTHAEQFNQNINSQGFGSANLARQSVELFQQYLGVAMIFAVQSVELKAFAARGSYDARAVLSPRTARLYEAFYAAIARSPSDKKPLVWNDYEQQLDSYIARVVMDLAAHGHIDAALGEVADGLRANPAAAPVAVPSLCPDNRLPAVSGVVA